LTLPARGQQIAVSLAKKATIQKCIPAFEAADVRVCTTILHTSPRPAILQPIVFATHCVARPLSGEVRDAVRPQTISAAHPGQKHAFLATATDARSAAVRVVLTIALRREM
jgi:hypothetical protein